MKQSPQVMLLVVVLACLAAENLSGELIVDPPEVFYPFPTCTGRCKWPGLCKGKDYKDRCGCRKCVKVKGEFCDLNDLCENGWRCIKGKCKTPNNKACEHNGKIYQHGERFKIECNFCFCSNGQPGCTKMDCRGFTDPPQLTKAPPTDDCPQGFTRIDGVCYGVFKEKKSWNDAQRSCIANGSFLAEPKSLQENKNIVDLVKSNDGGNTWIGATDKVTEGSWVWDHSETNVTFTAWAGGEPNQLSTKEDCAHLSVYGNHNYGWNDSPCYMEYSFVCQKPSTKKTCEHNGKTYQPGESFMIDCNGCRCHPVGQFSCTAKECPKPPQLTEPPRTRAPTNQACEHNGEIYQHGERFMKECNDCHCSNGHPVCRPTRMMDCGVFPDPPQLTKSPATDDICSMPKETGPCLASFPAYYFDISTNKCHFFVYGGCRGNKNRFWSREDCEKACMKEPSTKQTCKHNGKTYQPGESFKIDCNWCWCSPDGGFGCTIMACVPSRFPKPQELTEPPRTGGSVSKPCVKGLLCTYELNEMCGVDGKTYGNPSCMAAACVDLAYPGKCRKRTKLVLS